MILTRRTADAFMRCRIDVLADIARRALFHARTYGTMSTLSPTDALAHIRHFQPVQTRLVGYERVGVGAKEGPNESHLLVCSDCVSVSVSS